MSYKSSRNRWVESIGGTARLVTRIIEQYRRNYLLASDLRHPLVAICFRCARTNFMETRDLARRYIGDEIRWMMEKKREIQSQSTANGCALGVNWTPTAPSAAAANLNIFGKFSYLSFPPRETDEAGSCRGKKQTFV